MNLKIPFTYTLIVLSVIGFMVRLPGVFRYYDKELHFLFYFIAAGILNMLFAEWKLSRHISIFAGLFIFGIGIELAQHFSNRLFHSRIHGHFDKEDMFFNFMGQSLFSLSYIILNFCKRKQYFSMSKKQI
jgi:hypothetical protein